MKNKINIFWFRRDLRLMDNTGLFHALEGKYPVIPVFIFDSRILDALQDKSDARVTFIHKTLAEMNSQLQKHGAQMVVKHGEPVSIMKQLLSEYEVNTVYANHDYEPYARERDKSIRVFLHTKNVTFKTYKDQVIFEKDEILKGNGDPYTVYTPYSRRWRQYLTADHFAPHPSEKFYNNFSDQPAEDIPALKQFGFQKSVMAFPDSDIPAEIIGDYEKTRNFPGVNGTSRLGLHLRFGTVSIRALVRKALELNDTWLAELIWREFFMMVLWHFPHVVDRPFKKKYEAIPWRDDPENFGCWCRGETGYPIVDAGMRELNQTGFMHNRVRMITASFLTKHLLIDWRLGERYFSEKLLDYELASNNGNWQWAAGCGVDAAPYFRIFNPYTQAEKFDPDNKYIKHWVPEFQNENYVNPMVDHKTARQRALDTYAMALDQAKE